MKKLDIIYEDKELIVVNKPSKLLTIATAKEKYQTLYQEVSMYVKKQYPKNKIFIVNRLDRDTSGIVVFTKNEKMKKHLQNNWNELAIVREYRAIVEGKMPKKKDVLINYLKENKALKVYCSDTGDKAITHYEILDYRNTYSYLKINIKTGKKHQIRVQLSEIKHPIIGDKKYGAKKNPLGRMGLHACYLELKVRNDKILKLEAKIPKEFKMMFDGR